MALSHIYPLIAFCALQAVFHYGEAWWHDHEARMQRSRVALTLITVSHPFVIKGTHDWAIYLVGEMHNIIH